MRRLRRSLRSQAAYHLEPRFGHRPPEEVAGRLRVGQAGLQHRFERTGRWAPSRPPGILDFCRVRRDVGCGAKERADGGRDGPGIRPESASDGRKGEVSGVSAPGRAWFLVSPVGLGDQRPTVGRQRPQDEQPDKHESGFDGPVDEQVHPPGTLRRQLRAPLGAPSRNPRTRRSASRALLLRHLVLLHSHTIAPNRNRWIATTTITATTSPLSKVLPPSVMLAAPGGQGPLRRRRTRRTRGSLQRGLPLPGREHGRPKRTDAPPGSLRGEQPVPRGVPLDRRLRDGRFENQRRRRPPTPFPGESPGGGPPGSRRRPAPRPGASGFR